MIYIYIYIYIYMYTLTHVQYRPVHLFGDCDGGIPDLPCENDEVVHGTDEVSLEGVDLHKCV